MQRGERPTIESRCVQLGDLTIDLEGHLIIYPDGSDTILTLRQRDLLRVLIVSRGRILSYADLGLEAWHYPDRYYSEGGIRACICRLRRKLGDPSTIETVHTIGYRWAVPPEV